MKLRYISLILLLQASSSHACFDIFHRANVYSPTTDIESTPLIQSDNSPGCCSPVDGQFSFGFGIGMCTGTIIGSIISVLGTLGIIYLPKLIIEAAFNSIDNNPQKRDTHFTAVIDYEFSQEKNDCPENYRLLGHIALENKESSETIYYDDPLHQNSSHTGHLTDDTNWDLSGTFAFNQILSTICNYHSSKDQCEDDVKRDLKKLTVNEFIFISKQLKNIAIGLDPDSPEILNIDNPYYLVSDHSFCKRISE